MRGMGKNPQPCSSCFSHSAWGNISISWKVSDLFLAVCCPLWYLLQKEAQLMWRKLSSNCRRSSSEMRMYDLYVSEGQSCACPAWAVDACRGYRLHSQNMTSRIRNDSHAVKPTDVIPWGTVAHETKALVSFHHCLKLNVTPGCCGG